MRDFKEVTKMAITNIDNSHQLDCIKNILQAYGWRYVPSAVSFPANLYLKNAEARHWLNKTLLIHTSINETADLMQAWRFISEYQVPLDYRGYHGSYERDDTDKVWFGKLLHITDLVTYESSSLIGLLQSFHDAVDDYIETLEELKEKEKNMKELVWEITLCGGENAFYIINKNGTDYLSNSGDVIPVGGAMPSEYYFEDREAAEEILEEFIENHPELAFKRKPEEFVTADEAEEILSDSVDMLIELSVEKLIDGEYTFTRHDVVKVIRQVLGPDVEVSYDEWKPAIAEYLDTTIELYDYEKTWDGLKFLYSPITFLEEDEEEDSETETETADSATTDTVKIDASVPANDQPADTTVPDRVAKRHIIKADDVRKAGGAPGKNMAIYVYHGGFVIAPSQFDANKEVVTLGNPKILLKTTLKVDQNCNLRISKYMFDLANIGPWFGKNIDHLIRHP